MALRLSLLAALALGLLAPAGAAAHAVLLQSDPASGATLGAGPRAITLTFSEKPEAALSEIRVVGTRGTAFQKGRPKLVGGAPAIAVAVGDLGIGVYTVTYRVTSAVDGHATTGAFAFGVGASPAGVKLRASSGAPSTSKLEVVARWLLLVGLVVLLGTAVAGVARFGGDLALAAAGWLLAVAGLVLLAEAQRRSAGVTLGALLDTSVGDALVGRAAAIAAAGVALLLAFAVAGRVALGLTAAAALTAIVVHVAAGHAAAGSWSSAVTVTAQSAHFAAAGVWFGGLAALVLFVRGAPSSEKAAAVRRFSFLAAIALAVVVVTGTIRAIDELTDAGDLVSTAYGRVVLAKILLFGVLAALGMRNRRRSVPAAAADLGPLRKTSRRELAVAATALAMAAVLGALAPPVGGRPPGVAGLSDTADAAGTKVELTAASPEPGPNTFVAKVEGGDPGPTLPLRFTPLDDPRERSTTLTLARTGDGRYQGTGANLEYDGRWGVEATVGAATVSLELDVPGEDTFPTITRPPNAPAVYSKPAGGIEFVRMTLFPERAGNSHLTAGAFDDISGDIPVASLVLTMQVGDEAVRRLPVRRASATTFATDADLPEGKVTFAVTLHTRSGTRLRATFTARLSG